jgi:hypothetical protein
MKIKKESGNDGNNTAIQVLRETFDFKAVVTVKATPEEILSTLRDANNRKAWDSAVS